ncbi:MAG: glucosamine-6-phosphate deaminase [Oscillospiraceae bacterium]|nr:glucosamine-6-phosphate deaminase [Oscillospiraceae bacterium]
MKIIIDNEENIARRAARRYVELLREKPDAILGGATGSTPLGLYAELARLCKAGEISFARARSFNLDEYVGLDGSHDQSYRYFMNENLFKHIDIDLANTRVPDGINTAIAAEYDREIEAAGGIDLQLLGIGVDGHIGFNEPGTPWDSVTHVVELTENTREVNSRFFASLDEVPTHAVTMGIKTVMNARSIILMAIGKSKAEIVRAFIQGPVTTEVPASILQLHPAVEVYLDPEAAALL